MLQTDVLKKRGIHRTFNPSKTISTENVQIVFFGQLITKFLNLSRCIWVSLFPQSVHRFPEKCNTRMLLFCRVRRRLNELVERLKKANGIERAIHYERRECVTHVQLDIPALLNCSANVQTVRLQRPKQDLLMWLGCENDGSIPEFQSVPYDCVAAFTRLLIVRIEPHLMPTYIVCVQRRATAAIVPRVVFSILFK